MKKTKQVVDNLLSSVLRQCITFLLPALPRKNEWNQLEWMNNLMICCWNLYYCNIVVYLVCLLFQVHGVPTKSNKSCETSSRGIKLVQWCDTPLLLFSIFDYRWTHISVPWPTIAWNRPHPLFFNRIGSHQQFCERLGSFPYTGWFKQKSEIVATKTIRWHESTFWLVVRCFRYFGLSP